MEIKDKILDPHFPDCPIRNVIARIGDRWSILILLTLERPQEGHQEQEGNVSRRMRYKDIHQAIPDISQKMLSRTLRNLETDGLVRRIAYAEVPPRVEYELTARGHTLTPHLNNLVQWAAENISAIINDRKIAQKSKTNA